MINITVASEVDSSSTNADEWTFSSCSAWTQTHVRNTTGFLAMRTELHYSDWSPTEGLYSQNNSKKWLKIYLKLCIECVFSHLVLDLKWMSTDHRDNPSKLDLKHKCPETPSDDRAVQLIQWLWKYINRVKTIIAPHSTPLLSFLHKSPISRANH